MVDDSAYPRMTHMYTPTYTHVSAHTVYRLPHKGNSTQIHVPQRWYRTARYSELDICMHPLYR